MKRITTYLVMAAMFLAFTSVNAQRGGGNEYKQKLQAYNNQMATAILEEDDEKVLSFYMKDAISMPNYSEILRGTNEIAQHNIESREQGFKITDMKLTTKQVTSYGDALVEIGIYTITVEVPGISQPVTDKGKYLTVWVKYEGDSYKIMNEMWNTDIDPMARRSGERPTNTRPEATDPGRTTIQKQDKKQ